MSAELAVSQIEVMDVITSQDVAEASGSLALAGAETTFGENMFTSREEAASPVEEDDLGVRMTDVNGGWHGKD